MPKFSVRKPFTIFVAVVACIMLGFVSFTRMSTDLLPDFNIPYIMVITTYAGASPEKVESTVTEPLESELGTLNGVENVTSSSNENYSIVTLEYTEDTDMDSAMVKLSAALDQVTLPDGAGTPITMEMSMDMMATMYISIDYEGMDIYELTDFTEETVIPYLERQSGVASIDETGGVSQSVEIALNEEKISALNDELAAMVSDELDDAKTELDDAQAEIDAASGQLESASSELEAQQEETSDQLAQASLAVDQALAMQAAYSAQVSSLEAGKAALEAEKSAYEEAGVTTTYDTINSTFAALQSSAAYFGMSSDDLPSDIPGALENSEKLANAVALLTQMGQEEAAEQMTADNLSQLDEIVNTRLPQIETELANLEIEIAAAEAVLEQVNEQVQEASDSYADLESGKITAAVSFASAQASISSSISALEDAQTTLDEGLESYYAARDEALASANLDTLLSIDTLSALIYAQNFAMPAGYIYEGEDQYLLKVGDEYESAEELAGTLLTTVDGIGDILLSDVADVTWIDNSGDAYAKVNGNEGILLSIYKSSTAGTADVSDACEEAFAELEEEYEGLHITTLMDQGVYIDMIVQTVLKNLIYGAILAVIVLAIFLRSLKPTIVVAFSIPISVLVAVVLMYFSGVTINLISLSGLAMGVGMLVDNSIVVIENIYRLRSKGIPSARAAVLGARQVAGAITASTLTTVCVFFPIVFTTGIVRQLFVDMALTVAYSLLASLLVALTVVPSMSATLLKNSTPKPQKLLDKLMVYYEKALRFCLRRKAVPIVIAAGLLVLCGVKAMNTGLILFPSMGGEEMTATMEVNEEMTDEEAFELTDEVMDEILAIEGVETVGIMSGSDTSSATNVTSMAMSSGGSHSMSIFIVLDEETGKDNSSVAEKLEEIFASKDLEEYTVTESNMDMSSLFGDGLEVLIYGDDPEELVAVSEDVMDLVAQVEGFEDIENGQEESDVSILVSVDKDEAMRLGLTVAQIYSDLAAALTTEETADTLTIDSTEYDVTIVDETDTLTRENLMDFEFEIETTDEDGETVTEIHTLDEFASVSEGEGVVSISRENQQTYISVTAETQDGYNTTLLSRKVEDLLEDYEAPDGYTIEVAGESTTIEDAMSEIILMIVLAIALIYLIMVAQFQSLLSPFIVIFTIPLAFTGGLLALYITGQEISLIAMMGFLMLSGVIVNNGIVFVDYVNQLRLEGIDKTEALVRTGKSRMRPILMTTLTTVCAMLIMAVSQDAASEMARGMAIVEIGGLLYATLMTLFIIPVLYDLFFRRELRKVDVGDDAEAGDTLTVEEM